MQNTKITNADLAGKGVVGMPDAPGLSTRDMQAKLDEIALEVLAPKHNALVDTLMGPNGADAIGAGSVAGHIAGSANPHRVTATQTGAYTKAETDAQISGRIVDIGSADMTKAVYDANLDGIVDDSTRLGGQPASSYAKTGNAFSLYSHIKIDAQHMIFGEGDNVKFIASADFREDDSFLINGEACTSATTDGEPLADGYFISGAAVCCFKNGNTLNFRPGGAGLGIKVIAAATVGSLPAGAKEQTIAVVGAPTIGRWSFCSSAPQNPRQNDVWFRAGTTSDAPVNILKKNEAIFYGQGGSQYNGSSWISREVYVMKNGGWRRWT